MSQDVDIVIGAGDFGSLRRDLDITIPALKNISRPTILVPGNNESYSELVEACKDWKEAIVLHGNGIEVSGLEFYGLGGGIPETPFGSWSWDHSEDEAHELLKDCPEKAVLISHSPPKGILDISSNGQSLGSTAVRETIIKKSPQLVVCGHIHESSYKHQTFGNTTIINAGPNGFAWEL